MKNRRRTLEKGVSRSSLKAEWAAWWTGKRSVLFFAAKFAALLLALYALLAVGPVEALLYQYLEANAWLANAILNLLGQGTRVTEITIRSPAFAMAIRRGCDAVEPTWLLCAAMVAFPGSWRRKLVGMAAAAVVLQALNLVRLTSLYWIGSRFPAFFPSAHVEIWPAVFIMVSITLFIGWKEWANGK